MRLSASREKGFLAVLAVLVIAATSLPYTFCHDHIVPESVSTNQLWQEFQWESFSNECKEKIRNTSTPDLMLALDAFGKPPAGILVGNLGWLGHFDECISITDFTYCLANLTISLNISQNLLYGLCIPTVCTKDLHAGFTETILVPQLGIDITVSELKPPVCNQDPHRPFDAAFALTVTFFLSFFLIVVLSSLYHSQCEGKRQRQLHTAVNSQSSRNREEPDDVTQLLSDVPQNNLAENAEGGQNTITKIIYSFALPHNVPKLLAKNKSQTNIDCLNGMRVITMLWIILGNVFLSVGTKFDSVDPETGASWLNRYGFLTVSNGYFSIDTFFFLSGLLVTYLTLTQMRKRGGSMPWFWFYFHRYWRLTPSLAVTMLFYTYITPYFGHGPFAQTLSHRTQCPRYWWTNLLYINNFYPQHKYDECIDWVWYLANNMQFFVISPFIIFPLYHIPIVGFGLITILCVLSFAVTGIITAIFNFPASVSFEHFSQEYIDVLYIKPYCRITPYLVGMVMGYLFHRYPKRTVKINSLLLFLGWTILGTVAAIVVNSVYGNYPIYTWPKGLNIAYQMFSRFAWSFYIAWVVFVCHYGHGGWINAILGYHFWAPLGKLTYSAYLLHPIIIMLYISHLGTPVYLSLVIMAFTFVGIGIITYGCAALLTLVVEFPMANLEKIFFPRS